MSNNPMQKHEAFILDGLLPVVAAHARSVRVSLDEAALASFLALGTILLSKGFTDASLLAAIKASALTTHDAPKEMQ